MKMVIKVEENGDLYVNAEQKQIADLTQEFLDTVLNKSLSDEVEFEIAGNMPIADFFRTIQSGTGQGSELRTLKEKNDAVKNAKISAGENLIEEIVSGDTSNPS